MKAKTILIWATSLIVSAIILGAFGAHGLKDALNPIQHNSFLTGTKYHMYHGIALLALVGCINYLDSKWMKIGIHTLIIGVFLFSGSIYLLSTRELTGFEFVKIFGPITPIGGLILVSGWLSIMLAAIKKK